PRPHLLAAATSSLSPPPPDPVLSLPLPPIADLVVLLTLAEFLARLSSPGWSRTPPPRRRRLPGLPRPHTPQLRFLDMLDSNGNGMHHEDDDNLFTHSDPVLPDPSQMGAHDGILLREWRRYVRSLSLLLSPRSDRSGPAQFAVTCHG
ncbi:hypothetical protein ZWY2020_041678, partial [Hordeum vulgare]